MIPGQIISGRLNQGLTPSMPDIRVDTLLVVSSSHRSYSLSLKSQGEVYTFR